MLYYKSQVNYNDFKIFCLLYPIPAAIIWLITSYLLVKLLVLVISIIAVYIAVSSLICRYDFYEDRVVCNFIFSLKTKCKPIYYKDIELVQYTIESPRFPIPIIIFQMSSKNILASHSNSCSHRSFKKRKEILIFLQNKGVQIDVNPIFARIERERNILKMP